MRDQWSTWLAQRRHGGCPEYLRQTLERLAPVRDRVIHNAQIGLGSRVLDVGCGDGLIALPAAGAVGPAGRVIFSDVSADLLDRCRQLAEEAGLLERCSFVEAPARDLAVVADESVDAVTMRSVLIYEADKARALAEFRRVLRPAGRLSISEPINRFTFPEPTDRFLGYDVADVADEVSKVESVYRAIQPPDSDPMSNFDERDLLRLAEGAGFQEVHLVLEIDIQRPPPRPWPAFLNSSANPRIPTLAEAMDRALLPDEAERLAAHLRPLVEHGEGQRRIALAYLWAVR
jgi:arsenite methyltransferase